MINFKALYFFLFRAMTRAVDLLQQGKTESALRCLIQAQQDAEERYLQSED